MKNNELNKGKIIKESNCAIVNIVLLEAGLIREFLLFLSEPPILRLIEKPENNFSF